MRTETAVVMVGAVAIIAYVAVIADVGYVAFHFISKFW